MLCPSCRIELKKTIFYKTEVDYCSYCFGMWFEREELRQVKDEKDKELNWLDIDLWKEKKNFKISEGIKMCPLCFVPLYQINYGDSQILVDFCNLCEGIWLERGEFKKIIDYLKAKGYYEILNNYFKNLLKQTLEIFIGPENFLSELNDFLTLLKLLEYKFFGKYKKIKKVKK